MAKAKLAPLVDAIKADQQRTDLPAVCSGLNVNCERRRQQHAWQNTEASSLWAGERRHTGRKPSFSPSNAAALLSRCYSLLW
jgi:hypothetical protein